MSSKGYKHTEEAKQRISEARRKRMAEQGYLNSPEARQKMSETASHRIVSAETRLKMSLAKKGKRPTNFDEFLRAAHEAPHPNGEGIWNWKGDEVGYSALHAWIRRELGSPQQCKRCGTTDAKRYEWSNISKEYKRDLSDWIRLCTSCHRKEGYEKGEYTIWIKGTHIQTNTGRTHFKKGHIPANQYLEDKNCPICRIIFHPRNYKTKYCSHECYWKSMIKDKES